MVTDLELAWLAGLWDGEGSITIFKHLERGGVRKLCPTVLVVNTDIKIINESKRILDALGTSFHLFERKSKNPKHKTSYQLSTRNTKYIDKVLTAIEPYLIGKKEQAQLVIGYVRKRFYQFKIDEQDEQTQIQVQALNKRGP